MRFINFFSLFKKNSTHGIVVCRPKGGLNDILCQIEKCWRYADTHNRHLLVDTWRSGFLDDFAKYFLPLDERRVSFGAFDGTRWEGSIYPGILTERINHYDTVYHQETKCLLETETQTPLTFDFSRKYKEKILVHEQYGGGKLGIHALKRMKLAPEVAHIIATRLERFRDYSAVHVRNTDYQTDYVSLFEKVVASDPNGLIVLCTDDWHCQDFARKIFGDRVRMSSDIPNTDGRPLHDNAQLDRYSTNLDAITDLFVLALAKQLFVRQHTQGQMSGFAILAKALKKQRDIIHQLLGRKI